MDLVGSRFAALALLGILFGHSAIGVAADTGDVELFAQQPIMVAASLSPDGTQLAFLSSLNGRYHVVIERFKPEFSRYILYPGEELDFEWVRWANDERLLVSSSYAAKRDLALRSSRLYVVDTKETRLFSVGPLGQDLTAIIKPGREKPENSRIARDLPPPQIQDDVIDWLPAEPNHVLVSVDSNFDGGDEVRRVDIRDGSYKNVVNDGSDLVSWVSDQAGNVRIGWVHDEDGDLSVKVRAADGNWVKRSGETWITDDFVPLVFTADPDIVVTIGDNDAGRAVVRKLRISSGDFTETVFEHELYDADGIVIDDSNGMPVGVSFTEDYSVVEYFDPTMQKLQKNVDAALAGRTNRIVSTSKGRRQVLILSYTDSDAGSYYVWDRDEKALNFYSDRYSDMGEGMLARTEAVTYKASDGLDIPAYLTYPKGSAHEKLPTIVLPHGGPRYRDDKSYWFVSHFLAARGYAVLQPNFRGSSGYGSAFASAGLGEWGGKMQDDVSDGALWLVEQGIADPDRMCIVGWSYGGYAAAMGAVKTPDLFQCAVSINGVLDLPRLITDDKRKYARGREWTRHMGLDGESSRSVSPLHQAELINIPMLIVQSLDDIRVNKEQGQSMAGRLKNLKKEVEYVEIEFGGHSIQNVDGRKVLLEALQTFLSKHIG